jgi:putative pyruvate formate lyase activating enzyme
MERRRFMKITRRDFVKRAVLWGGSVILAPPFLQAAETGRDDWSPAYGRLEQQGKLARRAEEAYSIFAQCQLCPRQCGVNRLKGQLGFCQAPADVFVYVAQPHFGEEVSLVGQKGSGTIFFSNCNLRCVFCQNWPIAHLGQGERLTDERLADKMLYLQRLGCHNINLVTPTHVMPNIVKATRIAYGKGLRIPLVYNTSGYERVEILKLLDDIVDIYLPDMKYMDGNQSAKYSSDASDYPEVTQEAIIEMNRQVGVHKLDRKGVATRGLMIRHLVMPNRVAGTREFVRWVARTLPKSTYVNIMHQYRVEYKAFDYPEINRGITVKEYMEAINWATEYGLTNLDPRSVAVRDFYLKRTGG